MSAVEVEVESESELESESPLAFSDAAAVKVRELMVDDYWAYNVPNNVRELEAMTQYAHEQGLTPTRIDQDATGHAERIHFKNADGAECSMPARAVLVAAGTRPNTVLAREDGDNLKVDGQYFQALNDEGAPGYDHGVASAFAGFGIPSFACTPDLFPELMAAAIHLHRLDGDDEEANVEAVAQLSGLHDAVVIGLALRDQGLVVAAGNPLRLADMASIAAKRARLAQRPPRATACGR